MKSVLITFFENQAGGLVVEEALLGVAEISRIPGVSDPLRTLVLEEPLVQR